MTLCVLSSFAGLLACAMLHVLLSRAAPAISRPRAITGSVLAGLAVVVTTALAFVWRSAAWVSAADPWGATADWILVYVALAYCYVFGFCNLGESARRIRLLVDLHGSGERGISRNF